MTDHLCPNPCRWPSCLTREEQAELDAEVARWNPETCMTPEEEAMVEDYLRTKNGFDG